jgi:hypothetical protein
MDAIMALNQIDDPNTIVIGQVLRLPALEPDPTATPAALSPLPDVPQPGDEPAVHAPDIEVDPAFTFAAPPDTHTDTAGRDPQPDRQELWAGRERGHGL